MQDFNQGRAGRIDWVQEKDAPLIASSGFAVSLREKEFTYDRAAVVELRGWTFKRLRQNLADLKKHADLLVREFSPADEAACLVVYRKFRTQLQAKGIEPKGYSSMVNCLKEATRLPTSRLRGEVIEIDSSIRAYSFGRPISSSHGCVFVIVSDHEYPGLAYALRHQMMTNFLDLTYFNDSTDNKRAGLREMKQRFRPVEMHGVFGAQKMGR